MKLMQHIGRHDLVAIELRPESLREQNLWVFMRGGYTDQRSGALQLISIHASLQGIDWLSERPFR